ncbi:hypothetical protein CO704_25950 (plasmid) [Cedecea neteri]|uniref:Uncharacterized protein n=1 Tax=Cedecea neteri TaxID=158822 RepID=A0A291E621_9ENTR|nr:hypothetical protein CO704_25950 [Cedecea neteri]
MLFGYVEDKPGLFYHGLNPALTVAASIKTTTNWDSRFQTLIADRDEHDGQPGRFFAAIQPLTGSALPVVPMR